MSFPFVISL